MNHEELHRRLRVYDFARRSFRDVADYDYVLARTACRRGMTIQFLYLAHEAIEKYLKAILVYNHVPAKGIGHNLSRALQRVKGEVPFSVDVPHDVEEFVTRLTRTYSRYFEYSCSMSDWKLDLVDRTVWYLRRYCDEWRTVRRHDDGTFSETLNLPVDLLDNCSATPKSFHLFSGVIEDMLKEPASDLCRDLSWQNDYFGRETDDEPRPSFMSAANPTISLHPDAFDDLDRLVQFSSEFRDLHRKGR